MQAAVIEIARGQFAHDIVTVAKIHLRTTCLFAAGRQKAAQLLMNGHAESLWHHDIRETAFAEAMWYLYELANSRGEPVAMTLDQWTVSEAISAYLRLLEVSGAAAFRADEYPAVQRCRAICVRANGRFTSKTGWLPFA